MRNKGDPTRTNLWVLCKTFGTRDTAPNELSPTAAPHLRRCFKAGLFKVEGRTLVLTDAGRDALARYGCTG